MRIVAEGVKANALYKNGLSGSQMHPMLAEAIFTWEGLRRRRTHQQGLRSALASQVGDDGTSPTSSRKKRQGWSPETTHQVVLAKKQRVLERHDHQEEVVAPFGAQMPGGPPCTPLQDEDMPALDTNDILEEMEEMDEEDGGLDTSGILEEPPDSVKLKTEKFKRTSKKIAKKEPGED